MSRFRTTSTSRLLLIFAGLGAACGPIDDPVTASLNDEDVTNANQNAAKGSTLRDGDYPEYSSVKKAFSDVAQRIVGIDPKTQKITNVGLQNLAYELGFAYSANSCGTDWDVVAPASGKVVITSNHQTGAGPGCNQGPDRDTPTKYTLSDWYLADTKTELVKYEQKDIKGKVKLNEAGDQLEVVSLPSYTATLRNLEAKETQQLNAKYVDAITTTQTVTNSWNIGAELGVKAGWKASVEVPIFKTIAESSIEFKTYGGYQNSKTDTDTRTQTWECGTQVSVPPGCVYDAHFAVTKVRTDSQYRVKVTAKPYTASLSGFMRDASLPDDGYRALGSDPGCFFKKPGHIAERDVTHQRDKTGQSCLWGKVEEKDATFGGHDEKGKPFYQDIADQRHNDSGNWYWFMMAEGKDYIGQVMTESTDWPPRPGVPDVDVVIDRLSDDKLYHFSLFPLQTSLEDDVHCEITISKNPESLPECAQPAPGKTEIAPKPAPKNSSLFSPITVVGDP